MVNFIGEDKKILRNSIRRYCEIQFGDIAKFNSEKLRISVKVYDALEHEKQRRENATIDDALSW